MWQGQVQDLLVFFHTSQTHLQWVHWLSTSCFLHWIFLHYCSPPNWHTIAKQIQRHISLLSLIHSRTSHPKSLRNIHTNQDNWIVHFIDNFCWTWFIISLSPEFPKHIISKSRSFQTTSCRLTWISSLIIYSFKLLVIKMSVITVNYNNFTRR